jgi:DNA repair protein RadA/Sms
MAKAKSSFFCQQCGNESPKWQGKCSACGAWNSFAEEPVVKENKKELWREHRSEAQEGKAQKLESIALEDTHRIVTPDAELNRVLGGGIVPGSVVLVAGEPGIGKSTLFLQISLQLKGMRVLYVSGEESLQQIKMRAERIGIVQDDFYLLTTGETKVMFQEIKKVSPDILVIDSIQTLESPFIDSAPGSVSQVRECTAEIVRYAKASATPVFIIGHITKDGSIAGPKVLEHMVDTVLYFEGDRHYAYRMLRTTKNRFGNASELGIYQMAEQGLQAVSNPSDILITQKDDTLSGIAIAATIEGARPLLIETQALVTQSVYGTPQRTVSGFDLRRMQLLLAVLEKRGGFHFGMKDVFLNIAGGLRVEDPAIDLAVLSALLSSYEDKPLPTKICFVGEVGLSGEIRAVNRIEQRMAEAEKLGFETVVISKFNTINRNLPTNMQVVMLGKIEELYNLLF